MAKPIHYRQHVRKAHATPAEVFIHAGPEAMADRGMANKRRRMIATAVADQQHSDDDISSHSGSGAWTKAAENVDRFLVEGQRQASRMAPKKGAPSEAALEGQGSDVSPPDFSTEEDNQPLDQGRGIAKQTDQQKTDAKHRKGPWGNRQ